MATLGVGTCQGSGDDSSRTETLQIVKGLAMCIERVYTVSVGQAPAHHITSTHDNQTQAVEQHCA
jgi:hypothetical protein